MFMEISLRHVPGLQRAASQSPHCVVAIMVSPGEEGEEGVKEEEGKGRRGGGRGREGEGEEGERLRGERGWRRREGGEKEQRGGMGGGVRTRRKGERGEEGEGLGRKRRKRLEVLTQVLPDTGAP